MPFVSTIRDAVRRLLHRFVVWLNRITRGKLGPGMITVTGVLMHAPIAWLIATRHWLIAAPLLLVFGLFDALDGDLARLQKRVSNAGGFLDAATDRIKEVLLYTGAAYAFTQTAHPGDAVWAVAACGASICVSYIRAKGETTFATLDKKASYTDLNKQFRDGLAPFEVRVFLLIVGLLSGQLTFFVAVIAILAGITALQRLFGIQQALARAAER